MRGQQQQRSCDIETLRRVLDMEVVEDYRLAVDTGAGQGEWASLLAMHFGRVVAIEPDREACETLSGSVVDLENIDVCCQPATDAIDDFKLEHCGLIKFDAEGAELLALRGAEQTICRFRPVLVVEFAGRSSCFGHTDRMIQGHILASGYRELFRSGADRVFVPR